MQQLPKIRGIGVFENSDHVYKLFVYRDSENLLRDPYFKRGVRSCILILESTNNSVEESLAYIVPHLSSVKSISIEMNLPAEYYRPLSQVSKLQKIGIYPSRYQNCGPLLPLMASLASGLHGQLTDLTILAHAVSYDEAREIARMVNLRNLHCDFEEPRCLEHLTALKQLEILNIGGRQGLSTQSDVTNLILALLKACTGLNILMGNVNSSQLAKNFTLRALEVLKTVRDPSKQKPLGLGFNLHTQITNEELTPYLWFLEHISMG
ncbi:uncharacterized protein [Drosophila takahashii]|uniref:uncharacterized protein n=1 Tax=Drosophila takahashii TaxID=29030 RepID=UPI0038991DA2